MKRLGLVRQLKFIKKSGALTFCAAGMVLASAIAPVAAQDGGTSNQKPAINAVTGSAWQTEVTPSENRGSGTVPEDQKELVTKINAYLQKFNDLAGRFVQTNPDGKVQKGKFYVLRPGRVRFDYARPSMLHIVSDGTYLSVEDHDLKTVNRYPLESTPFKMLLKKNVKLERDAKILAISSSDTSATITISDRSGKSAGEIQLFFSMPGVELKEWVITDAQGLHTRIEVGNIVFEKKLAAKLFKPSDLAIKNIFNNNR